MFAIYDDRSKLQTFEMKKYYAQGNLL